jgi:hypothetical protein
MEQVVDGAQGETAFTTGSRERIQAAGSSELADVFRFIAQWTGAATSV